MDFSYAVTLNLVSWLALTGLAQSLLILVYVVFRVRSFRQAALPLAYFLCLALAFALQFAMQVQDFENEIQIALWFTRILGPPLCTLLVIQISDRTNMPAPRHLYILLLPPAALLLSLAAQGALHICGEGDFPCTRFFDWLYWLGAMAGAFALLKLWRQEDIFGALRRRKGGKERYWLVLTLVVINVLVLAVCLLRSSHSLSDRDADALLVMFGIAFSYLATTTLFRVYPLPVALNAVSRLEARTLTPEEAVIAEQVRKLMEVDKLYQEPAFSRADLARELKVAESRLSHIINTAFGKNFPQLLNELRVGDAKIMLRDPAIAVQTVATEAGFNSIASFNRVFREMTGETPTSWRESAKNEH